MTNVWYTIVQSTVELTQGELILNCPLVDWKSEVKLSGESEKEVLKNSIDVISADVVVMTQACDLENHNVNKVILCPHISLEEFKSQWEGVMREKNETKIQKRWENYFKQICAGSVWNLAVLNSFKHSNLTMNRRIVDFHSVYSVPRSFLESIIKLRGKPRLQLLPPYREHLSQGFARFFMRIGLPTPVESD